MGQDFRTSLRDRIAQSCPSQGRNKLLLCIRASEFGKSERRTADPSTTLRSGRDDKREGIAFHLHRVDRMDRAEPSIPVASFTPSDQPSPLSSRPERSVAEGSAVRLSDFPNSHADTLTRATA